ncbi:MAG: branched-chain amino acid transport system permease protein [Acidobacteriota bacterium]|jgi:branched-chain amino acid transport system permease protein|nr:branched-chain amino acid transport system permease protein [Acidobacteriota bacterium]
MEYLLHILILICIYSILAISLDLTAGHTGLLSMAHAAFYGLGAYTSSLLAINIGAPFLLSLLSSMVVAALASLAISLSTLRLHDDYFVIATFGFQMILFGVFNNWIGLTRGSRGIQAIPQPIIFGLSIQSHIGFAVLATVFTTITFILVRTITLSPFGRVLRAIREDETFAQAVGKNTIRFKVTALGISAALAAVAGSLYAHYVTYIDPTSFTVTESILIISMVIIGGAGSTWGPVVGATILVAIPEILRFLGLPSSVAANLRQISYGAILLIMMMVRPRGILGRYEFRR